MLGWMNHKDAASELLGEISITSDRQVMPLSMTGNSFSMKMKGESENAGLKLNIQKTNIMASSSITSWQIVEKKWKQRWTLFSWAPKSLQTMPVAMFASWKKNYDKYSSLKSRDITLPTEVLIFKATFFPVVMYICEYWTIKKPEH